MTNRKKKKIQLAVVIGSLNRGGAERHLLSVLPRLIRFGFSITVYCLSTRGELAPEMEAQGVQVLGEIGRRSGWGWRYINVLLRVIGLFLYMLKQRPEIVHFFLPAAYILGTPAAIMSCRPIKIMSRRSQNNYQNHFSMSRFIERQWHRRMTIVLGNSQSVVDQLLEEGVPKSKLHLIYNGVDLSAFDQKVSKSTARKRLGLDEDALIFVIVANLISYKGHADLLRAFAKVKGQLPENWVLLCAGRDDGIGASLKGQAEDFGLIQHVHWLGSVKDVPALLMAADVALLSSHEEGFSNAILEYMAAGLPAIVTDVGGNAEAVRHGRTGLVVPPRNPGAMGEAILRLVSSPVERERLGAAALVTAYEHYSLDACAQNYADLYMEVLKDHGMY